MRCKIFFYLLFLTCFFTAFLNSSLFGQGSEVNSVTTYYPAPYGIYQTLRLFPTNPAAFAGLGTACADNGTMFYSNANNQIITCTNNVWQTLGGDTSWTLTGNNLYPRQNAYNVVIGGQTAVNKLDISGGVAIGASYAGTNIAPTQGLIVQGNVGIGTPTPSQTLEVAGPVKIGAYTLPATDGTNGQILVTNGSGVVSWQNPPMAGVVMGAGYEQGTSCHVEWGSILCDTTTGKLSCPGGPSLKQSVPLLPNGRQWKVCVY